MIECSNIHHVGLAVNSIKDALQFHIKALGMIQLTEIVHDELQNVKVVLLGFNQKIPKGSNGNITSMLELVEPVGSSPIDEILKKRNHLYHYCIEVPSLEEALKKAREEHSVIVLRPTPAKLFNGRKIAFVWTPAQYLLEFLEKEN